MKAKIYVALAAVSIIALISWLASCGGSSSGASPQMAKVNTLISDPPTCSTASGGAYSHVYVTIADVKIHQSASAGPNDSGWVDLTPNLTPTQIDLLNPGSFNGCFLAQLGSTTELQAGTYQQIRVYLAPDSVSVSGNNCSGTNNCVVYNGNMSPLQLSSETQTGIKIPSGQLAGGKFTIGAGQTKDLGLDFDACASIVRMGNGNFRLKPVLHAGEVSLTSESINGKLVDSSTGKAVPGATGIVALETKDTNGIDRMVMQTAISSDGSFVFCPVPAGTYDVVAVIEAGSGTVAYSATITTGVQPGAALGNIPMFAQTAPNAAPGFITGQVTTAGGSGGIAENVTLSALEPVTLGGTSVQVTIPLAQQMSTLLELETVSDNSCPSSTDCLVPPYNFAVPTTLPYAGTFAPGGTNYTQTTGTLSYTVDAMAFQPASSTTPTCSPSELMTSVQTDGSTPLDPASGATVTAKTTAFTGCQ